jgi:hypothetical protein
MQGFISYSHQDFRMFAQFRSHLAAVERGFSIEFWADQRIHAGYDWNTSIEHAIERSSVFILLASPDFIASDYIYNKEIPAIQKRRRGNALVLPVVLKRCAWPIIASALQAIPSQEGKLRPIADFGRHSDGFDLARDQIQASMQRFFGITPRSVRWT